MKLVVISDDDDGDGDIIIELLFNSMLLTAKTEAVISAVDKTVDMDEEERDEISDGD